MSRKSSGMTAKQWRQRFVSKAGIRPVRRKSRRLQRGVVAKLARNSHVYPPQSGSRRPEFSSAVAGEWSSKAAA